MLVTPTPINLLQLPSILRVLSKNFCPRVYRQVALSPIGSTQLNGIVWYHPMTRKMYAWAVNNWYQCSISGTAIGYEKCCLQCTMCAITVILFSKSLFSHLVQKPSFYAVPGLRYEGKYKLRSIIHYH